MPRFAANLSMLYPEHDFLDRFEAAAADAEKVKAKAAEKKTEAPAEESGDAADEQA